MDKREGRRVADNNVSDVLNTIDSYQSGSVRALAQDPPQNSADARRNGMKVEVAYRVHHREEAGGEDVVLLTITDSGTTGLDGPILTPDELGARELEEGELVIRQGENWAAWEAQRYTKTGEDKLGSRGQGKYAYMYHSAHPVPALGLDPDSEPKSNWRMVILYDTLLPSGEYRLGVRFHNPAARVFGPFLNEDAFDVLRDGYDDGVITVPLGLEPLSEVGTRVIIPFLGFEARKAIDSEELHRWLRLEWWRQIQKGELSITVDSGDGLIQHIGVPGHWADSPWERDSESYFVREHVDLPYGGGWKIKRLVLFHDEALPDNDYPGNSQEVGIQMLRGGQWIMTLGVSEFSDLIPRQHRKGIRGFVEFDRLVEGGLREIENPAHDGFKKQKKLYQEISQTIRGLVEEFARERGWLEESDDEPQTSYDDLLREVTKVFIDPDPGPGPGLVEWLCRVSVTCQAGGRKADWGESIEVAAECRRAPVADGDTVEFQTMLVRPDGSETQIFGPLRQRLSSRPGREYSSAGCDFGRLDAVHPGANPGGHFQGPGRYTIVVRCTIDGREVAQGRTGFYVDADPPPPPPRLIGMELHPYNGDTRSERFEDGDALSVVATVRNYGPDAQDAELNIAVTDLEDGVLLREAVSIPGVSPGTPPEEATRVTDKRTVREIDSGDPASLVLPKGRHEIRASFERSGELLATARVVVNVGADDEDDEALDLPFTLESDNRPDAARWIYKPAGAAILPTVVWSDGNPTVQALSGAVSDQYVQGIIVEGVIEWAVRAYEDGGDEIGLSRMTDGIRRAAPELLNEMEDRMERLKGVLGDSSGIRDVFEYGNAQRRLAAVMTLAMAQSPN
jgi:hypothetical protein